MAANMFAAATSLFGKSSSLSAYTVYTGSGSGFGGTGGPSPSSSILSLPSLPSGSSSPAPGGSGGIGTGAGASVSPAAQRKPFGVGLWRILPASHKTTGKEVSVWVFEKKLLDGVKSDSSGRPAAAARDCILEQLKKEATSLSRLRHPDILHMIEPLEETRSELTFVTEVITASLHTILQAANGQPRQSDRGRPPSGSSAGAGHVDLDEVEIQKGTLQIAKGLAFLHTQARMVHLNLSPESVLVNAKGDWKLSGLSLTTPLQQPDGSSTPYVFPEVDKRLPLQVQWKYDYLAPEYALDSQMSPANDLYSLGCVLYALHMGGKPPFVNHESMSSLRGHAEGALVRRDWASGPKWERCSGELRDLLPRLLTRHASSRLSLASLPSHSFFSSLAISTLNFLDATAFASKPREEKATFLRGLVRVLPTFSERLRTSKVLPSLLEEMKDPYLLPFILPNVFEISKGLSKEGFQTVLPKLQPLFALKDPPQNMLSELDEIRPMFKAHAPALLEHISLFEHKTSPIAFRESVMPLIYNSLECEHLPVQEKALKLVPHLSEILDYGTVQNILLVKVAILFTKTRALSIKVQTLECFTAMVKTLDKVTLTTKLVPLLAKIKTKEPAVMMATLAVHEAMGAKVDREAIATLVLPQLWAMSMGPLLNADQFGRFMTVIKSLGSRVEAEHTQHLRDVRRLEAQTASFAEKLENGSAYTFGGTGAGGSGAEVDFEALVRGGAGVQSRAQTASTASLDPWDAGWADADDGLSNALSNTSVSAPQSNGYASSNAVHLTPSQPTLQPARAPSSTTAPSGRLGARPVPSARFDASLFDSTPAVPRTTAASSFSAAGPAALSPPSTFAPLQPTTSTMQTFGSGSTAASSSGPNYNLSLAPQPPVQQASQSPLTFMSAAPAGPAMQQLSSSNAFAPMQPTTSATPSSRPPPGFTPGLMQPTIKPTPALPNLGAGGKMDWGDFDPLG